MSVDEKPPDSGFQPLPTSVLMFGSLLTIVVARGAAFGEKAAAEPSASARTVLAMAVDLRVGYRSLRCLLDGVRRPAARESLSCAAPVLCNARQATRLVPCIPLHRYGR